jgi:hypothetical protein
MAVRRAEAGRDRESRGRLKMSEALILEFEGVGRGEYDGVNAALGIDQDTGEGLPAGLLFHTGASKPGGFVVFEIWDSKSSQETFMADQLAPALGEGGITGPPSRAEWLEVAASFAPGI